jgi:hypothetical protein
MTTFETGATSHAVNELILFTDTTRELVELRDKLYRKCFDLTSIHPLCFEHLEAIATSKYCREVDYLMLTDEETEEYCTIYAQRFQDWKKENGY